MGNKIVVIGGGPGGYVAAIRAAQLNNEVTLIEKEELGGTCLNRGCIPTKALIQSANALWEAKRGEVFGVQVQKISLDFPSVIKRKEKVVKQLVSGVQFLIKKNKVKVIKGIATIIDPKTVRIADKGEEVKTDSVIIATGSVPSIIPVEGIDSEGVIDSNQALQMQELPASIAIVGGGVIGIEFAQIFHRMGVAVTVIEMMPHILPTEDSDLAQMLESILRKEGVKIFTSATVKKISTGEKGGKVVSFAAKEGTSEKVVDKVLIAVGRSPETSNLGLEKLEIETNKGSIVVNGRMQACIPGVYAIGDVIGGVMLAHSASAEGKCAAENASGISSTMDYRAVPRCIYTTPEIACVGLTELRARKEYGDSVRIGKFPLLGNSKALILDDTSGFVKVIVEAKYGEVLGIEIVGPHATELIGEAVLGMRLEATFNDFASAIHAHPTVSESIMEAALNVEGKAIHI
jgi:dihydrolipoamide dehydrogenase